MVFKRRVSKRKPRRKAPKVSKAVKVEVAKQLSKSQENKLALINGLSNTAVGTQYLEYVSQQIEINSRFRGLLPRISDGTDAFQRMGNSITPKVLKIKGLLYFIRTNPFAQDLTVRVMVVTHRSIKNQDELTSGVSATNYATTLLWNGQTAQPVAYLGNEPYYNQLPINRRAWNVLADKQIHLRKGYSWPGATVTNESQGETFMSPTRSVPFEIVLTQKQLPAKLLYQAPGSDVPTNFAPVLAMGWADNTHTYQVPDSVDANIVGIQWTSSLIYEDA